MKQLCHLGGAITYRLNLSISESYSHKFSENQYCITTSLSYFKPKNPKVAINMEISI